MSLRNTLGAAIPTVHEQVESLLDSEDAMLILVGDSRTVSYMHGFGLSPDQLELLALEIERAVRSVAAAPFKKRDVRTARANGPDARGSPTVGRIIGRVHHRSVGNVADDRDIMRSRLLAEHKSAWPADRVLRLARKPSSADSG